jgi:hypothetical protein
MVKALIYKFLDGDITAAQYVQLCKEEEGVQLLKSDDRSLIEKAAAGDEDAYFEYGRRVDAEKGLAKYQARQEMIKIEKEFNDQLKELILKSGDSMTDDQREAFVWTRNLNNITERYQNATRTLDMD